MLKKDIIDETKWKDFLDYKLSKDFISKKEKQELSDYILNKKLLNICTSISNGTYIFSNAKKHLISKRGTSKKRTVYTFNQEEMIVLKYISYLLYKYDYLFSPNLYSFRKSSGVKEAIYNISKIKNLKNMYGYKVDISDYFNSINVEILLNNLKKDIDDVELFKLLERTLSNKYVQYNDQIILEEKGVMAGTPISAFLANYYIKEIDEYFWNQKLVYFRYADDIIIFCNNEEEINKYQSILFSLFEKYNLNINKDKEYYFKPMEKWEFLGFSFDGKNIDLSDNSIHKIKGKIRRSARGIRRWMIKKDANYTSALKAMNRKYNKKFFGKQDKEELSWKYWYFPTINTSKSLKEIDKYMQEYLRYIVTGKHNKRNFKKVPYKTLKECNYKSLVNEYYKLLLLNVVNDI